MYYNTKHPYNTGRNEQDERMLTMEVTLMEYRQLVEKSLLLDFEREKSAGLLRELYEVLKCWKEESICTLIPERYLKRLDELKFIFEYGIEEEKTESEEEEHE